MLGRARTAPLLDDLVAGARLLSSVPAFLRHTLSLQQARAVLRRRLEHRASDFLSLARQTIYGNWDSPYRLLLAHVGCEYGDLARLVGREGLETALRQLYQRGVYLTPEELKGRQPVVRGSVRLVVRPGQLRNPNCRAHLIRFSGGSRGGRMPVPIDLVEVRDASVDFGLALDARGALGWRHALWELPGGTMLSRVLRYSSFGAPPARLFAQLDDGAAGLHRRYRWSRRALYVSSLLAGRPLPRVEVVSPNEPLPIARWMVGVLRSGRIPHLMTYVGSAVRLCQAAQVAGLELRGAELTVTGEPTTAARLATIRRSGARAAPFFGSTEAGNIGCGCLAPAAPDDLHFLHDLNALIQAGPDADSPGLPAGALLLTSLRSSARLILLNVSLGDRAEVSEYGCDCPLAGPGWRMHLQQIRSYEKVTAGGMTFPDAELIPVLEEALPARFGGGPTDYQLVEEEDETGRPQLRLLVAPAVGPLDDDAVAEAFLAAIGDGSGVERVMSLQWRQSGLLRVERRPPFTTASGKILHLLQTGRAAVHPTP